MSRSFELVKPRFAPPLDESFRPAALANREFRRRVVESGHGVPLILGLERPDGSLGRYETIVFADGHPMAAENLYYAERTLKFLVWQKGGWKVYVGGPPSVGEHIRRLYARDGDRAFDFHFMGDEVCEREFTVMPCASGEVPDEREQEQALGRHLDGYRIGFDLGASDLKVSAVVDGEAIFSEEIVWEPRKYSDPSYHYERITAALRLAASKLPRVDAIGGSAAGIYINNRPMVASLFRGIPKDRYGEIREMFLRIRREMGVPLEVVNDGEVTALAGSMSLGVGRVLGLALGSSEAAGYVTASGSITGWLDELAFAPVDFSPVAPVDEWSGDRGVGARYFSQQAVFRLAPAAGIEVPEVATDADRLKFVQKRLQSGHPGAAEIWRSIGRYMGYSVAHYAGFYDLEHVLILGRVTSGSGGPIIVEEARRVLEGEFPELAARIRIQLPDEKSRRVGQSIAAASLPAIGAVRTTQPHEA
jgi:predicted NBD/HSP70 family sugar kinase